MKVAVTGGTGFIGKQLVKHLQKQGDEVIILSRSSNGEEGRITWEELEADPLKLDGVEAIVNLAGETINQRWTSSAKDRILQSRLQAVRRIADAVDSLPVKPQVVVNGSAIAIYGISETAQFDERSQVKADDFLAGVVRQWEAAADSIPAGRLIKLRTGLVLGNDGGAFSKLKLPYKMGVGGRLGSGNQWMSWIHIEDVVRMIDFCLRHPTAQGPVNATAPRPVKNEEFGKTLGKTMKRPHWFPVPEFVFQTMFGELASLLIKGQRVFPWSAKEWGFKFKYPYLEAALTDLTSKPS